MNKQKLKQFMESEGYEEISEDEYHERRVKYLERGFEYSEDRKITIIEGHKFISLNELFFKPKDSQGYKKGFNGSRPDDPQKRQELPEYKEGMIDFEEDEEGMLKEKQQIKLPIWVIKSIIDNMPTNGYNEINKVELKRKIREQGGVKNDKRNKNKTNLIRRT